MSIVVRIAVVAVGAFLAFVGVRRVKSSRAARREPLEQGMQKGMDPGPSLADETPYAQAAHSASH